MEFPSWQIYQVSIFLNFQLTTDNNENDWQNVQDSQKVRIYWHMRNDGHSRNDWNARHYGNSGSWDRLLRMRAFRTDPPTDFRSYPLKILLDADIGKVHTWTDSRPAGWSIAVEYVPYRFLWAAQQRAACQNATGVGRKILIFSYMYGLS